MLQRKHFRQPPRRKGQASKLSLKTRLFFCREKPGARAIQTPRVRILRGSAPIRVPGSNGRSAAGGTAAVIAADSVDVADARRGARIVRTAGATVVRIEVQIGAVIEAGVALSVEADMAHIADITADTRLPGGLN